MKRQVALFGGQVEHSLSPAMQTAAFQELGLDWSYRARAVTAQDLAGSVSQLRQPRWAGANITVPHKERVIKLLDSLDPDAARMGAVNTILTRGSQLHGSNTDGQGLVLDLKRRGVPLRGRPVIILGAGGAARAAAWGLADAGAVLTMVARTPSRAQRWIPGLAEQSGQRIEILAWSDHSFAKARAGSLVVNATPVGMWPRSPACPWPATVALPEAGMVYDLIYRPRPTELVARAREAGLDACGGLGMLVEQGALALELWTGLGAPRLAMRAAAERALEVDLAQLPDRR